MSTQKNPEKSTFEELWVQLSHNQRRFVVVMQEYPNKAEAAKAIGLKPNTVYGWSDIVDNAIDLLGQDIKNAAVSILTNSAAKAAMIKSAGLDSQDENMRQEIASEVLDRILGKAIGHMDIQSGGKPITPHAVIVREHLDDD